MTSKDDYSRVTSSDGYEFFLNRNLLPKGFATSLPYSSRVVEKLIEYLHYKHINSAVDLNQLEHFPLDPEIALDVLKASIELKI